MTEEQSKLQLAQQLTQLSNTTLNIDGTEVTIGAEFSKLRGAILKGGIARMIGNDGAIAIDFKVGKEEREILVKL